MRNLFLTQSEAAGIIRAGAVAVFAGSEQALATLPPGQWIGGTTIYFMTSAGGVVDTDHVFCTILDEALEARFAHFQAPSLSKLTAGQYGHGLTYLMVPAFSAAHQHFAVEAPSFPDLYQQPVMGWVTGVPFADIGSQRPQAFFGPSGEKFDDAVLALYLRLPERIRPVLDMVNPFTRGDGPDIVFPHTGFEARDCLIDGVPARIGDHLAQCDTRMPLVADYAGTLMNVSVRDTDSATGVARFFAPVVAGEPYRMAQPVSDVRAAYTHGAPAIQPPDTTLSCICLLNFLYARLEGKSAGGYVGPVTFGEIAYILVNQTLVRMSLALSPTAPSA